MKDKAMTDSNKPELNRGDARLAGALYLTIAICGGFSIGYVPAEIIVAGDAAATSANLLDRVDLFRAGVLADCAMILLEIAITVILFRMFQQVSPRLALIALVSRAGMIMVMGINLLFWVMPYVLLTQPTGLDPSNTQALGQVFFEAHTFGVYIWQLFFGTHLLAIGWIILRSQLVPHLLGWGLFIGAFGYLLQALVELSFTDMAVLDAAIIGLLIIVTLSELGFAVWLLVRGPRKSAKRSSSKTISD